MSLTKQQCKQLKSQDLLTLIIEEASEVIQAATKVRRFGPHERHPERLTPNFMELLIEGYQLKELLNEYAERHGKCFEAMGHRQNSVTDSQFKTYYPYTQEEDKE